MPVALGPFAVALERCLFAIGADFIRLLGRGQRIDQRMFGRDHHVGRTKQRIGTRGVDAEHIGRRRVVQRTVLAQDLPGLKTLSAADVEIDFRPAAATDPVLLQLLDPSGPVQIVEPLEQTFGIGGDPQHPLPQRDPLHRMATAFALAVDHLFIGEHRSQRRTPVDQGVVLVCQTLRVLIPRHRVFALQRHFRRDRQLGDRPAELGLRIKPGVVQHQENPLCPANVIFIGRRDRAVPVVAETEHLELPGERLDVAISLHAGVFAGADRVLFGRQSKRVKAHRMQHAVAPHPAVTGRDVGGGVALGVTDMQPIAAGVREHVEDVTFLAPAAQGRHLGRGEGLVLLPVGLPARFDFGGVVSGHGDEAGSCRWGKRCAAGRTLVGGARVQRRTPAVHSDSREPTGSAGRRF